MAKFTRRQQLKKTEETQLIMDFCEAISSLSRIEEAMLFIRDLLSKQEVRMLAKRLKIAKLLIADEKYEDIAKDLKTSMGTIARINTWLAQSGEGFRTAIEKSGDFKAVDKPRFSGIKRKYPMYYWPEILLKEIIYSANRKQRLRLQKIIDSLDEKTTLTQEIDEILRQNYNTT